MSDLIDRQAAINAIKRLSLGETDVLRLTLRIEDYLERLPSAQPEQECEKCIFRPFKQFQSEPRWIPCSERLPDVNGRYLVTRGLNACGSLWNRIYIANYSDLMGLKSERIWWNGNVGKSDFERIDDVIAWMPLPEPWRGEEDE